MWGTTAPTMKSPFATEETMVEAIQYSEEEPRKAKELPEALAKASARA